MSGDIYLSIEKIKIKKFLKFIEKTIFPLLNESVGFTIMRDNILPTHIKQDNERLTQILIRIIQNAIKYTNVGSIALQICLRTNNDIEFSVVGTGPGMSQETIQSICNSASLIVSNTQTGSSIHLNGLGLATIQLLLEKMGSKLDISSEWAPN